jgi:hypothetical protein
VWWCTVPLNDTLESTSLEVEMTQFPDQDAETSIDCNCIQPLKYIMLRQMGASQKPSTQQGKILLSLRHTFGAIGPTDTYSNEKKPPQNSKLPICFRLQNRWPKIILDPSLNPSTLRARAYV